MAAMRVVQPSDSTNPATSELAARDRESLIIHYLDTLLRNIGEDVDTACGMVPAGTGEALARSDASAALAMAGEYVQELGRLAGRPIAGPHKAA